MPSSLQRIGTARLGTNQSESGHLLPPTPNNVESRSQDLNKNRPLAQPSMAGMAALLQTSPVPPTLFTTRQVQSSSGSPGSWTSMVPPSVTTTEGAVDPAAAFSPSVYSPNNSSLEILLPPALYLGSLLEPLNPNYALPSGENGRDMAYSPAVSFLEWYHNTAKAAQPTKTTTDEGGDSDSSYGRLLSRPVSPAGVQQLNETDDSANTSGEEEQEQELWERKHFSAERHRVHSPFPFAAAHAGSSEESHTYRTLDNYRSSTKTLPVAGSINNQRRNAFEESRHSHHQQHEQQSIRRPATLASERSHHAHGYIAARHPRVDSAEVAGVQNAALQTSVTTSQSHNNDDNNHPDSQRPVHTERHRAGTASSSFHPASTSVSEAASAASKTTTTGRARRPTGLRRPTDEQLAARLRAPSASQPPPPSYSTDPGSKPTGKRGIAQGARELHNPREPRPAGWDNPNDRALDAGWMSRADWDMLLGIQHTMCQMYNEQLRNGPGIGRSTADSLDLAEHTQIVRGVWARDKEKADRELEREMADSKREAGNRRERVLSGIRGLGTRIKNSMREGVPSILVNAGRVRPGDRGNGGRDDDGEARRLLPNVHVLGPLPDEMDWDYLQARMNRQR